MSKIEVNQISSQCGSTLTIGQSGDTVTLAAGATQTGFGRTGTVDWDTTAKTASFTAVSGNGYFVNTTSGAITVTLPATPSAGDIVAVADYAGTSATNNITIARNGSNFQGGTDDGIIAVNRQTATFVYVDGTQGWVAVNSNDQGFEPPAYVTATGGTVTCCGDYKIHTFTGPGTFTVTCAGNPTGSTTVDYLIIGGGGGGGSGNGGGGGGGAGGYRESSGTASGCYTASPLGACVSALPVSAQGYPITVGGGGNGGPGTAPCGGNGSSGSNSIFSSITSAGGGGGGGTNCGPRAGVSGGSGGGSAKGPSSGGSGNTPPVSPPQGNPGGNNTASPPTNDGGGGGGAGDQGETIPWQNNRGGNGGIGVSSSISASSVDYAGGGGANSEIGGTGGTGGVHNTGATPLPSAAPSSPRTPGFGGGLGHSGTGCQPNTSTAGTTNRGGGGGGIDYPTAPAGSYNASNGGSGIVIIRYRYQ